MAEEAKRGRRSKNDPLYERMKELIEEGKSRKEAADTVAEENPEASVSTLYQSYPKWLAKQDGAEAPAPTPRASRSRSARPVEMEDIEGMLRRMAGSLNARKEELQAEIEEVDSELAKVAKLLEAL